MKKLFITAIFLLFVFTLQVKAKETTLEAFSSWNARGQIYQTGVDESTFVGTLSGIIYVKDSKAAMDISSIDAGVITCPGNITINTSNQNQYGTAKCIIITPEGDRIYASFDCKGRYLHGCNGNFTLTGGTGDKSNISGGGPIQIKSALSQLAVSAGSIVEQSSVGLAVWPALTYKISSK